MKRKIPVSENFDLDSYDDIIDVRSPSEFEEDHIPGAINLPVLDDVERKEVGTIYKQVSPFEARKLGAALINSNIALSLQKHLGDRDRSYKPLVYCWRGGQRSGSMAIVLNQIGWEVTLLKGGYKFYRSQVRKLLESKTTELKLCVIAGLTGTAKTRILKQLEDKGEQVIDLEGLANHKGSLLGHLPDNPQPNQKFFESLLTKQIKGFNKQNITWIESESSKVGNIHIPESLWKNMKTANVFNIDADLDTRVKYIVEDYPWFTENKKLIKTRIECLRHSYGAEQIEEWNSFIDSRLWDELVSSLLTIHYDQGYSRSLNKNQRCIIGHLMLTGFTSDNLSSAADGLINSIQILQGTSGI